MCKSIKCLYGDAIEGWIARTATGTIGFIKGCFQPDNNMYYFSPRIVHIDDIKKDQAVFYRRDACLGGKKVYMLDARRAELYSPIELKKKLKSCRRKICVDAREFIEYLPGDDRIGVSGRLGYDPENAHDIDIIVYGQREGEKVYKALIDLREDKVTEPFYGVGRGWSKYDAYLNKLVAERRVIFGLFRGVEYNVRIVPCVCPQKCIPRRTISRIATIGVLVDNRLSFTTPAYYIVRLDREVRVGRFRIEWIFLVTYRLKYSDLPAGLAVEIEGDLELFESLVSIVPDHRGYVKPLTL